MKNIAILDPESVEVITNAYAEIKQHRNTAIQQINSIILSKVSDESKKFLWTLTDKGITLGQSIARVVFDYYDSDSYKTNCLVPFTGEWVFIPRAKITAFNADTSMKTLEEIFEKIRVALNLHELDIRNEGEIIRLLIKPKLK